MIYQKLTTPEEIRKKLPLLPAVFHIMLALADGEKHGYGIKREVEFRTGGIISLGPGTLYGTLQRMFAEELIEEGGDRPDAEGQRRRYYRLTELGRRLAGAEAARLDNLVRVARAKAILAAPGDA